MALTRQRESVQLFVATETAQNARQLAWQMGRGELRAASVAWATLDELTPAQRQRVRAAEKLAATAASDAAPVARLGAHQESTAEAWLIPPYAARDGRDSLGRSTAPDEVAAAVATDPTVHREREALTSYLRGAYRDPQAARGALGVLVEAQGWTSAAARVAADPGQLGTLRGSEGLLAGAKARAEREAAQRAAGALAPSLQRVGAAEAQTEQRFRGEVGTQRAADAIGIPRLSVVAEAAIAAIAAAQDNQAKAKVWHAVQTDTGVARELRAFGDAVRQRFGDDVVRAMLRAKGRPGAVTAASVVADQQAALDQVSAFTAGLNAGERAGAAMTQAEAERQVQRKSVAAIKNPPRGLAVRTLRLAALALRSRWRRCWATPPGQCFR